MSAEPGPLPLMIDTNLLRMIITKTKDPSDLSSIYDYLRDHRERLKTYQGKLETFYALKQQAHNERILSDNE